MKTVQLLKLLSFLGSFVQSVQRAESVVRRWGRLRETVVEAESGEVRAITLLYTLQDARFFE